AWNACTAGRAGTGGYPNASAYPSIPQAQIHELDGRASAITSGLSNFTYHLSVGTRSQASIDTDGARNGALVVPLDEGKCQLDKVAKLPATVDSDALVVVSGITTKKTDAPFTLSVAEVPDGGTSGGGASKGGCACRASAAPANLDLMLIVAAGAAVR